MQELNPALIEASLQRLQAFFIEDCVLLPV